MTVPEHALVRTACLPGLDPGRVTRRYAELGDLLLSCIRELNQVSPLVEQELFELAATAEPQFRRQVLLPLRRDVHNRRQPSSRLATTAQLVGTPALAAWLALRERADELEVQLVAERPAALAASRRELARLCEDEAFRRAVALTSPELLRAVRRTAELAGEPDRRGVKSEPTVLRHVLRGAAKTTPLSWFVTVGWACWDGCADYGEPPAVIEARARAHPDLAELANVVAEAIGHLAEQDRPLRLAPGSYRRGDRWVFRRAAPTGVEPSTGSCDELVELPLTGTLRTVLDCVSGMPSGGATATSVAELLASGDVRARQQLRGYLGQLTRAGVLIVDDVLDPQSETLLEDAASWASSVGQAELADNLAEIGGLTRGWATTGALERPAALARLDAAWARVSRGAAGNRRSARVSEDVIAGERLASAVPGQLAELRGLAPLFEVFDWFSIVRRAQRQRFVVAYGQGGRCRSVAEYARRYNDLWQDPQILSDPGIHQDPVLADLLVLRAELAELALKGCVRDEVVLSDRLVATARGIPAGLTARPASYSAFVQSIGGGLCVNQIYGGWSRFTSRFLCGLPTEAAARARHTVLQALGPQARPVQLRPVQGFAANRHPLLFDDEITERAGRGTVRLDELEVAHDLDADEIRFYQRGHDRPLDVLYLGFLVPLALPPHLTPLVNDLGSGLVDLAPLRPVRTLSTRIGTLRVIPRLRYRRTVLGRRTWLLDGQHVHALQELLSGGSGPVERVVAGLRAETGWPRRVFLGAAASGPGRAESSGAPGMADFLARMGQPRSHYLDLGDALHLHHAKRILARYPGGLRVEEALPEPEAGSHATEYVLETYRPARRL